MPKNGFVDKNLFGLKERLRNYTINEDDTTSVVSPPIANPETEKKNEAEDFAERINMKSTSLQDKDTSVLPETLSSRTYIQNKSIEENIMGKLSSCASSAEFDKNLTQTEHRKEETTIVDKEYLKALSDRKKEFIRTRSDVLSRIKKNLEKLPTDIQRHKKNLTESIKIKEKLTFLFENINAVKEKEWDKKNFSLDLASAMKKVENARLELFSMQQKTNCILEEDIPGLAKNKNSFVPELTSLSAWQIFKLGLSFFFPLIIGLILTGILISIAMFIAMGVI